LKHDWRAALPEGFTVNRLDKALLERPGLKIPEDIPKWLKEWGSIDDYLAKGFGFVTIHENEIVSWSLIDGVCGDTCEAGIYTAEDFQRRGLGAITTAALVEHSLSNGLKQVSWQCASTNTASIRLARKVGFERQRDYLMVHVLTDAEANQKRLKSFVGYFREDAEQALQGGEFWDATIYMEQALGLQDTPQAEDYHMAARAWTGHGDHDQGWQYLNRAVDSGWDRVDETRNCKEFSALQSRAEWPALLERIVQNEQNGE
jgi:GNAT superfamily N-acetyltransferase